MKKNTYGRELLRRLKGDEMCYQAVITFFYCNILTEKERLMWNSFSVGYLTGEKENADNRQRDYLINWKSFKAFIRWRRDDDVSDALEEWLEKEENENDNRR